MLFAFSGFAQRQVSGSVVDDAGIPLPGASIIEKGTNNGTSTDFDGNFTISVADENSSIEVSFIGYETSSVLVGLQTSINFALSQGNQLEEVVVTSLGITRDKKSLGYAVSTVEGESVSAVKNSNFLSSLQGKVAGLDIKSVGGFAGGANVVIRGYSSLSGSNQALFVVDGTPISNEIVNSNTTGRGGYDYGNGAMDVNPDDIESVSVLKGAAATALYGSRGSNGVVMITTKKGSKKDGYGVSFNSSFTSGTVDKSTLPTYQKEYGAGYGPYYNSFPGVGAGFAGFGSYDVNGDGIADPTTPFTEDASFGAPFDGAPVYQWNSQYPELPNYKTATPWLAARNDPTSAFVNSATYINNISVQDANENGSYRISWTNLDMKGVLENSLMERNTVSLNTTYNITDKLIASASVNLMKANTQGRNGTGYDARNLMQSWRQWFQVNVDVLEQKTAYFQTGRQNATWNGYSWDNPAPIYFDNPYFTLYENYETDTKTRYFGNTSLSYEINNKLSIIGQVSFDTSNALMEERIQVGSVDPSSYSRINRDRSEFNYSVLLNYKDNFGNISFNANAGANLRSSKYSSIAASSNGGLNIASLYTLSNSANAPLAPSEYTYTKMVDGAFASASLGYKDAYYVDLSIRRDRSSSLPKANNKYVYPAISGTMILSEIIDLPILDFAKLRASYAEVGNDTGPYNVFTSYDLGDPFDGNGLASNASTGNNTDLKAERTKETEFGIETTMLNRRVTVDLSFYNRTTSDLLTPVSVSNATGLSAQYLNAGVVENKGVELVLSVTPIKTTNLRWDITGVYAKNKNTVVSLAPGLENLSLGSFQGGTSLNAAPGQPYGTFRGRDYVYTNGQPTVEFSSAYGGMRYLYTPETNNIIGDRNPDWTGGLSNNIRYNDFNFSFVIDTRQGGKVWSLDTYYGFATGIYDRTAGLNELGNPKRNLISAGGGVIIPGVTADGQINTQRSEHNKYNNPYGYGSRVTAQHLYDASFVKLREVKLTYDIPSDKLGSLIESAAISLIGKNLWIISKELPYSDPEAGLSAGNLQGYQSGAPPAIKELGVSLNVNF